MNVPIIIGMNESKSPLKLINFEQKKKFKFKIILKLKLLYILIFENKTINLVSDYPSKFV